MSAADAAAPVSAAEAKTLFAPLARIPVLVLAVSGGPDSTALMMLAARWRAALARGPKLVAVTVDHGLRPQSAAEARAVKELARRFGVSHRTVRWRGEKPASGLQQAAREARYQLLALAAKAAKASHVVTAHTLDDQAETVLIRMTRGSGVSGLAAMAQLSRLPTGANDDIVLVRPLLDIPKARLVATLARARVDFIEDASNRDPRFTRARLRAAMPALAREGLDARRLAQLARRLRRADAAIDAAVADAAAALSERPWSRHGAIALDAAKFARLPAEVALRLLGRAIAHVGEDCAIRLGKLEALYGALAEAPAGTVRMSFRVRRTLAGALVTLTARRLVVERAPARTGQAKRASRATLTTADYDKRSAAKRR